MMQVDASGRPVWARQFGTGLADSALAATGNPDGDGIAGGWTDGDLEGPSKGGRDSWMSRFDPSGNQRWITQLGSSGTDSIVAVTATGEASQGTELFLGAGVTDADIDAEGPAINAGLNDAFVAAVGTDGSLEWISQFGSSFEETVGGVAADGATVYVVGSTGGELGDLLEDGGPGGARDGYLAALDAATGTVLWVSRFGSAADETMTGLAVTEDGLLVASGTTTGQMGEEPAGGGSDGFVIAFPLSALGGGAASSV
jgi:outer membrane protein assembly factor BamB